MADQRAGGISWTDATWNPIRGCSIVSEGCRNCYAMKFAHRFSKKGKPFDGLTKLGKSGPTWTGDVRFVGDMLALPLRWRKPQRIFVNSMSDLFHEDLDPLDVARIFAVMARSPRHTFQILTKRPAVMRSLFADPLFVAEVRGIASATSLLSKKPLVRTDEIVWPLQNVYLGVSVEHQKAADERIPDLLATPAAVRWLSIEPLLGPVDISQWTDSLRRLDRVYRQQVANGMFNSDQVDSLREPVPDWIVCGGESGPGARAMAIPWATQLREQCVKSDVPFFMKQLGSVLAKSLGCSDKAGKILAEFPVDLQVREYPREKSNQAHLAGGSA